MRDRWEAGHKHTRCMSTGHFHRRRAPFTPTHTGCVRGSEGGWLWKMRAEDRQPIGQGGGEG